MLHAGHNPAGGLMVLVMLVVLVAQIPIGLFANDGLKFSGPLAHLVTHDDFDRPTRIHSIVFNFILALVWLNLVAVGYYYLVRGDNLIGPMLSGKKNRARVPAGVTIMLAHPALALVLLLASAAVVAWILF
jgi:cytochrome b